MSVKFNSIRSQLLSWLMVPILTLWLVGSAVTYFIAIDFANDAYDDALADTARSLASQLQFQHGQLEVDLPPAAVAILEEDDVNKLYYQIIGPHGRLISGSPWITPGIPANMTEKITFRNGHTRNNKVRVATMKLSLANAPENLPVYIQVAETLTGREKLADEILVSIVLPQFLMIVLAGWIVWFGIAKGLDPLERVREAVSRRTPKDLHPLRESDAPVEVRPLVQSINGLLHRLAEDLAIQKRFAANAAHQLRTPLAGLKTQTELALRQKDPEDIYHALNQIQTGVDRAVHLVQQLLALSRTEPGGQHSQYTKVDLNTIARATTRDYVPEALKKNIDLGFEGSETPVEIQGDPISLREMIANLIENAVRYTQPEGQVTVRLKHSLDAIELVVQDNGPGIPVSERLKVFERFYRILGSGVDGSGLGLAIVYEIAQIHGAEVSLNEAPSGRGTTAKVSFPLNLSASLGDSATSLLSL